LWNEFFFSAPQLKRDSLGGAAAGTAAVTTTMPSRPSLPTVNRFLSAEFCGTFIDDSGTPGQSSPSEHLHPGRKTWVALVLEAHHVATVYREMPGALSELARHVNANEFHAVDIYGGTGEFASASLNIRLAFLESLAYLFATYRFPVLVQTFSPANVAEHEPVLSAAGTIGPFDFTSATDAGLLLLIRQVREYLAQQPQSFQEPCVLVADEGRCKAGAFVPVPPFASFAIHGGLFFESSRAVFPLQLADFAAFSINRTQWLLSKQHRTDLDNWILCLFSTFSSCFVNLPKLRGNADTWTPDDFDDFQENDRGSKGLKPKPPPA